VFEFCFVLKMILHTSSYPEGALYKFFREIYHQPAMNIVVVAG